MFTEATMTVQTLPPPCPSCAGKTALKEMHRLTRGDGFMCFFRCERCELEVPVAVGSQEPALTGWKQAARKRPGTHPRK